MWSKVAVLDVVGGVMKNTPFESFVIYVMTFLIIVSWITYVVSK
jgi:hypothetical protein